MTQFGTPQVRRAGGELDVYTGLLMAAVLVLAAGVVLMCLKNTEHSGDKNGANGGVFKLVEKR